MSDDDRLLPGDEDPVLDGYLHSLHRLTPRAGFEERVLARVWRPAPMFMLVWRDRVRRALSPRRVWSAAGAAAVGSTAWLVGLVSWLASAEGVPAAAQALASGLGSVSWDAVAAGAAGTSMAVAGQAARLAELPAPVLGAAAAVMLLPAVSGIGLFALIRWAGRERVGTHAAR